MSNDRQGLSITRLKELVRERSKRAELPLAERRALMDANAETFPVPAGVSISVADIDGMRAEWARVSDSLAAPVVLYFHGGGYVNGSSVSHRHLTARLALAARANVLSVDYRLAPEHPFPAAVEDGTKAWRWLLARGHAPEAMAMAGDSAGGGLVAATLLAARRDGLPMPAGAALLSPWSDLTCDSETYVSCAEADPMITQAGIKEMAAIYLGGADPRDPLASPNFGDLAGLPPLLIQVGSDEVLLDDARDLEKRARAAGVEAELEVWDGMIHVWHAFYQMLPEGERAIERIGGWLAARWQGVAEATKYGLAGV